MEEKFTVQMSTRVLLLFFAAVAVVASATTWSFRAGFTWTGICLIAVAAPLALFYWYMIYVNPTRALITLDKNQLTLQAPPFLDATIPYTTIKRAFMADLKRDSRLQAKQDNRIMRFFNYVCGSYTMQSGGEAIILTNKKQVVCLESDGLYLLLGPDGMKRFTETLLTMGVKVSGI